MITENLSTLKIHKLTQEQYDRELTAGNIDENALYLTPDEGITLEQIGAAPAGYGLGGAATVIMDWNTATANGFYADSSGSEAKHSPFVGKAAWGYTIAFAQNDAITQVAFTYATPQWKHALCQKVRHLKSTVGWSEWEWVNPPMESGVEYRTTERFQGKPVYARIVNFDECSSSGTPEFLCDNTNVSLIRVDGYWYDGSGRSWSFASNYFIDDVYTNSDGTSTFLIVESDPEHEVAGFKGVATVYYIKN